MNFFDSRYFAGLPDEDKLLAKKVNDCVLTSQRDCTVKNTNFLDERQCDFAADILNSLKVTGYHFTGGYTNAVRKVLFIIPQYAEYEKSKQPFSCMKFTFRSQDDLSHRDFLGAFMSFGFKREMIGDILVYENHANVFVINTLNDMIISQISKIGNVGVKVLNSDFDETFVREDTFSTISGTVASMRLDCIVSLCTRLSREKASLLIRTTGVVLNYNIIKSPGTTICKGDIFSVRGYGKYMLSSVDGITKKDKTRINIKKFV